MLLTQPCAAAPPQGDLKPCNVLIKHLQGAPYGRVALVSDFGLSRALQVGQSHRSTRTFGTLNHTPPELLRLGRLSPAGGCERCSVLSFHTKAWTNKVTAAKACRPASCRSLGANAEGVGKVLDRTRWQSVPAVATFAVHAHRACVLGVSQPDCTAWLPTSCWVFTASLCCCVQGTCMPLVSSCGRPSVAKSPSRVSPTCCRFMGDCI